MSGIVREEIIGDARLILGDCREMLPTLDPAHAVVCDPPYGISFRRGASLRRRTTSTLRGVRRWSGYDRHAGYECIGDSAPFDPGPLLGFAEIIMWGADHYRSCLPEGGRFLAWDKLAGKASWDSFADVEFAWHSQPGASRIFSHLWKGVCSSRADEATKPGWNLRRDHPLQKPVLLMVWCIGQLKSGASSILDPFMGSGTTGVACAQLGRRFIGIEIEPRWFNLACRRIEKAQRQGRLFEERFRALPQESLFGGAP